MIGKTFLIKPFRKTLLAAAVWSIAAGSFAQSNQGLGDMIFTTGTVTTDPNGREWAYLSWMATDLNMLLGIQYDIYAKDGDFSSSNPYALKGTAQLQTDPKSITILNGRAVNLGQDLPHLENAIDQLFAEAVPAGNLSLGEKVAAVIDGSLEDTEMFQNVIFMSQAHPALTLSLGRGFACPINSTGITSFEIRDHNSSEIIGRIRVEGGNPTILPAPENLVQTFDTTPKGHLNIRLRWESPADLRRLSLMQFGYSLYRMDAAFAQNNDFDDSPPAPSLLRDLAENNAAVKKVNTLPILPNEDDVTPETYFFIDDNDGLSGGTPFVDGERFFYFVTALDLLGRDGEVSEGYKAVACDRVAPRVPKDIRTRALYNFDASSNQVQSVEISWDQDPDAAETHAYYVYRYDSISIMQANAANELFGRIAGPVDRIIDADRLVYTNQLSAADQDRTYWFTVRAIDDAYCGPNLSLNSAPVHGGIHNWEGPEEQLGAAISIYVETLTCAVEKFEVAAAQPNYDLEMNCIRTNEGVQWAEFAYLPGENANIQLLTNATFAGRFNFDNKPEVTARVKLPENHTSYYSVYCRVGNGMKTSDWQIGALNVQDTGIASFIGDALYGYSTNPGDGPHISYAPVPFFPLIEAHVPPDAGEYRFYRRVSNGPRTLFAQGETTNAVTIIEADEQAFIANGGTICYYYQFFDFNGNPGPMTRIDCVEIARAMDLPVPILNPLESIGTEVSNPGFNASWFCAPQGVERFEVAIHTSGGTALTATFSPDLRDIDEAGITNFTDIVLEGITTNLNVLTYMTGRVGANFGIADSPKFLISAGIELGIEYILMLRAVGPNGERGNWSEARSFIWTPVPLEGPDVPWPTRPLPPVENPFEPQISTRLMIPVDSPIPGEYHDGIYGQPRVGVRIGEIGSNAMGDIAPGKGIYLNIGALPESYLYKDEKGRSLFPCVLYRYQIASAQYPQVSGDVAQVSVMMESIAYGTKDSANSGRTTLYDPYIRVARKSSESDWGIYLVDTHPVMRGANYQYLLMRFSDNGEAEIIYNVGTVSIPE